MLVAQPALPMSRHYRPGCHQYRITISLTTEPDLESSTKSLNTYSTKRKSKPQEKNTGNKMFFMFLTEEKGNNRYTECLPPKQRVCQKAFCLGKKKQQTSQRRVERRACLGGEWHTCSRGAHTGEREEKKQSAHEFSPTIWGENS